MLDTLLTGHAFDKDMEGTADCTVIYMFDDQTIIYVQAAKGIQLDAPYMPSDMGANLIKIIGSAHGDDLTGNANDNRPEAGTGHDTARPFPARYSTGRHRKTWRTPALL
ncbi:MAG: hypothetical protein GDA36_03040 [Rhodobacteraceae bacterium]|nr:hypothetical protein [Paracoccaceae bacterium]